MTRKRIIVLCICMIAMVGIAWSNWPTVSSQTTPGQTPKNDKGKETLRPSTSPTPRRPARPTRPTRPARPANNSAEELLFWDSIKDSKDPADFNAYLTRYGESGKFSVLAHNRLKALGATGTGDPGTGPGRTNVPSNGVGPGRASDTIEYVYIGPATFTMGSPENEAGRDSDEGPQHRVTFSRGFYIGKYEITQAQWRSVMDTDPSKFDGCDTCPVETVSWDDAQAFIAKLNARNDGYRYSLPTEAQFEYVMRGGTTGIFAGNADALGDLGWYQPNAGGKTHPVGQKRPNAYGVYDIHGNAQEWVQDVYTPDYEGAPTDGSARTLGPAPIRRGIRGGSYADLEKYYRSAFRVARPPDDANEYTGFRVVRTPLGGSVASNFPTFEFAYIAPASFMMGSPEDEPEREDREGPRHEVRFARGFYFGKYEVTQAQWFAVMGNNPSSFTNCAQCPVDTVSWDDAQQFIEKLNARNDGFRYSLPTEAQWEYVMRAGTTGAYAGDPAALGWYEPNSGSKTHPVGQKPANRFGVYDVHGNVQEWIQDVFTFDYVGAPTDGSARTLGPSPIRRVIRGGSYIDDAKYFRSAWRVSRPPDDRNKYNGFRLVRMPVR